MIRREGRRIIVSGPVTLTNVTRLLEEGRRHLEEGVQSVDLGEVTEMDSSLLALLLAWLRDAKARNQEVSFTNLPNRCRRSPVCTAWIACCPSPRRTTERHRG